MQLSCLKAREDFEVNSCKGLDHREDEMKTVQTANDRREFVEVRQDKWVAWKVNWSGVWVGALATVCAVLIIGLIGIAVGAHLLGPEHRVVDLRKLGIGALIFSVCGAFFSFALGAWVAGKITGILYSEPAILHSAIVWLVTVPVLVALAALGASNFFGGWFAGLAGTPSWASPAAAPFVKPEPPPPGASAEDVTAYKSQMAAYQQKVNQWNEDTPKVTRNSALGAVTALLLGLVGSVIGGWMASGEPMNFSHYRTRKAIYHSAV